MTLAQDFSKLEKLAESRLHICCGITAQSKLAEVLSALKSLCRGHPPCFTAWGGCSSLKKLEDDVLPSFLVHNVGVDCNSTERCRGKPAAVLIFEACREKHLKIPWICPTSNLSALLIGF